MNEYDNNSKGVLFKNDKKGNDKAPDYKGKGNFGGKDFQIAAWIKESKKDGTKFMSLKFDEPYNGSGTVPQPAPAAQPEPSESEIPF